MTEFKLMKLILAINYFFYKSNKFFVLFELICANFYNKRRNYATDMDFFFRFTRYASCSWDAGKAEGTWEPNVKAFHSH